MSASDFLEEKILGHIFGAAVMSVPDWYVGLSTTTPTDTANVTEPTDSVAPYARQAVGTTTRTNSTVANDAEIAFPTAGTDWGTITHFVLYDAVASTGNLLGSGALASQKTVTIGDIVKFAIGALTITLD